MGRHIDLVIDIVVQCVSSRFEAYDEHTPDYHFYGVVAEIESCGYETGNEYADCPHQTVAESEEAEIFVHGLFLSRILL